MSWIGDKAEATANVLKELLTQTPAAKLYRQGLPNVLDALLNTREEEWRSKIQAMPKPFDASPEAVNRDMEAAMAFWNPAGMLGKIVYHGSPHKFDKFDASKIGTGEGAQAYGHGVYLADSDGVASGYARALGGREFDIGGRKIYATSGGSTRALDQQAMHEKIAADALDDAFNAQSSSPAQFAANRLRQQRKLYPEQAGDIDRAMNVIADWQERGATQQITGQVYKADLPDEWIPKMLDWDKPIGQQPEVQRALGMRVVKETEPSDSKWLVEFATGKKVGFKTKRDAMTYMTESTGGDVYRAYDPSGAIAARQLQPLGIPGIRYLDGGSRGAGQGSYNYVVFPGLEDKVKILERNGQPVNMIADALMRSRR